MSKNIVDDFIENSEDLRSSIFKELQDRSAIKTKVAIISWLEKLKEKYNLQISFVGGGDLLVKGLYEAMPEYLQKDEDLCLNWISVFKSSFEFMTPMMNNKRFLLEALIPDYYPKSFGPLNSNIISIVNKLDIDSFYETIGDRQFVKKLMAINPAIYMLFPPKMQEDRELLSIGLKASPQAMIVSLGNNQMLWNLDFVKEAFSYAPIPVFSLMMDDSELKKSFFLKVANESSKFFSDILSKVDIHLDTTDGDKLNIINESTELVEYVLGNINLDDLILYKANNQSVKELQDKEMARKKLLKIQHTPVHMVKTKKRRIPK